MWKIPLTIKTFTKNMCILVVCVVVGVAVKVAIKSVVHELYSHKAIVEQRHAKLVINNQDQKGDFFSSKRDLDVLRRYPAATVED